MRSNQAPSLKSLPKSERINSGNIQSKIVKGNAANVIIRVAFIKYDSNKIAIFSDYIRVQNIWYYLSSILNDKINQDAYIIVIVKLLMNFSACEYFKK